MKDQSTTHKLSDADAFDFFELADIPAVLFDTDLNLLRDNKPFKESFSYARGETTGGNQTVPEPQVYASSQAYGSSSLRLRPYLKSLTTETPNLSVDVEICAGMLHHLCFALGPNNTLLLTLRNLTAKSGEEQKLRQLNLSLQRANKELAEFSHAASHDLRSPLRAMRTIPEWISTDLRSSIGHVPEPVAHHLAMLQQQSERLENMLDDLLTYTRIGRYDNPDLPVSLQETLNQLEQELMLPQGFEVRFPKKDQLLRVPEAELRIALHNLIDNAVRHHHQRTGHVSVELCERNHHLLIYVVDDGPGIPKKYHQTALKLFSTLHSRDDREGSGMGLPTTNKIIHNWGGNLSINAGLDDRGTRITLTIPSERCVA